MSGDDPLLVISLGGNALLRSNAATLRSQRPRALCFGISVQNRRTRLDAGRSAAVLLIKKRQNRARPTVQVLQGGHQEHPDE
jgi:hypothetical protein